MLCSQSAEGSGPHLMLFATSLLEEPPLPSAALLFRWSPSPWMALFFCWWFNRQCSFLRSWPWPLFNILSHLCHSQGTRSPNLHPAFTSTTSPLWTNIFKLWITSPPIPQTLQGQSSQNCGLCLQFPHLVSTPPISSISQTQRSGKEQANKGEKHRTKWAHYQKVIARKMSDAPTEWKKESLWGFCSLTWKFLKIYEQSHKTHTWTKTKQNL